MTYMKKIINILLAASIIAALSSCMKIDNFDEPNARVYGRLIDKTTGQNMLVDNGDNHLRIWEMSYSTNPTPQDLAVKEDGTFNNNKLFAGTYDMVPLDGSYWPCDTTYNVKIGPKGAEVNFEVTPYLHLVDFKAELDGLDLTLSCRLEAPVVEGLPQIVELRPFLSLNKHCGGANHIDYYFTDSYKISVRKTWEKVGGKSDGSNDTVFSMTVPVKAGYTYWCRMGAQVNNTYKNYNYSEIVKIEVPAQQ